MGETPERRDALRVDEATTLAELEALRPEWTALWERAPVATPFQSPEWLIAWWRHFGGEGLWTLALRRGGRLVGLAPLFVRREPETGLRQATMIGRGITDHLDVLLDLDARREGSEAIFAHLARRRDRWDLCDFRDVPPDSPLLDAPAPPGWQDEREVHEVCPALPLPPRAEELAGIIRPGLLEKLRYYRRRAERWGEVRVDQADERSFDEAFGALLRLHGARWSARGQTGVLDDPTVQSFHREAARGLLARGVLRLYTLRVAGRVAAVYYGFVARQRAYYYLGGFDPELARLSVGNLVVWHAIQEAIREGAVEFDFLRGQEPYKYAWGAKDRPSYRRRLRPLPSGGSAGGTEEDQATPHPAPRRPAPAADRAGSPGGAVE